MTQPRTNIPAARIARAYGRAAAEAIAETLWPTRCALCDEPGSVLCEACERALPYIDAWRACPVCGSPFGHAQCTECNPVSLGSAGRDKVPFESLASACVLTRESGLVVTTFKDRGEVRLAREMARIMAARVSPEEARAIEGVAFVPATGKARARRGFDHAEVLAHEVADALGTQSLALLSRPRTLDQRSLSRRERMGNMARTLQALPGATCPRTLLVVDDVCTTGATLYSACEALSAAGAQRLFCLTFARAW